MTATEPGSYKDTVSLPKTQFDMRANATKREPEIQKFWADNRIYEKLSQSNPGEPFVLHDGPPYSNGALHIGHAMNKILKDTINKFQLLNGRKVRYIPGWDCHGLPIEVKVLQAMKPEERRNLTPIELRRRAKAWALEQQQQQCASFMRYGVWGDWEHPYLTLTPDYEAAQIGVFGQMVLKGYIYRGFKPVHWSPSSRTALAEAELEYPEGHVSRSIYAAFPVISLGDGATALKPYLGDLGVAVWTTTPWTIPANLAVAVNPELTYAVVKDEGGKLKGELGTPFAHLIVAKDLVERLTQVLGTSLSVQAEISGKALEFSTYRHPLFDRESPIVIGGDYVTTESGTGLVHTAPGHGQDDFIVGQRYGLPVLSPVDDEGNFTAEAGPFAGLNVLGDANAAVIKALREAGALLKEEDYGHRYPYDWRTKKPTIFRATEQWFASVEGFREEALRAIKEVEWIPAQGENRITAMVSDRSDWCISRQRSWGVPIPVFYDEETNEPLLNADTISHVQKIFAERGSDAWWEMSVEELLPEPYRSNGRSYRKGFDTMDVWFDSGSSWAAVAQQREGLHYPVEMYLEGSDQHRGWFQSSLLTSVAVNGHAPYKTVLTHGFALDEQGRKMSKSLGNVVDPAIVIEGGKNQKEEPAYGADVLRLWVSSVDYTSDVPLGKNILKQMADVYRKIRNTARFLLGNLHDFDPATHAVPYDELPELDRYMLHRMTEVFADITDAFKTYEFFRFFQTVQNFCVVDLSNFYLDIAKDRLYISAVDAPRRRSCQTVLAVAIENLARAIAPVLSHLAEDIWQFLPYKTPYLSVFESGWVKLEASWENPELAAKWEKLRDLRTEVNKVLEQARNDKAIGSSLEAKVLIYAADADFRQQLEALNPTSSLSGNGVDELRYLFLASQVDLLDSPGILADLKYSAEAGSLSIGVVDAEGKKCDRCWNYSTHVGESAEHPLLCERCIPALEGEF
ncbi:isoleucine--tRNA ligase [Thermoleptolyngbya oregonensis NK1-22]|uniref:Isoleucine--tRNA ligase n=2 Tax=Thermoleptolyngbya TaxID=2303528 RepID=A0AA96Y3A4_9CYAN|nr:isoleucine--tRNA ligase [Thermoleptolyngbya oregonensis]WOB42991.1 isoleucine--tRNA ligase [Thermoleptolyngbya oregonensis NK1-22]